MSGIKAIQFAAAGVLAASASAYASAPGCKATDAHCVSGVAPASLQLGTVGAVRAGLGPDRKIPSKISVDAGSYRINGGEFSNAPGFVNDGDIVSLRMPAAHHCGTVVTQTLRIEGQPDRVFRVITRGDAAPLSAAAYASTDVTTSMPWAHYGKLTLPVDEDGKPGADEVEGADVGNYSSQYWYQPAKGQRTRSGYIASGDETVFWAPVNGTGRTKTATTPRTEMREQISVGDNSINWGLSGNHVQKGTVVLTAIPTPIRSNTRTFIVFAQIHSVGNAPPIKLFFQRLPNGSTEVLSNYNTKPVKGASVNSPVKIAVRLGEKFTYEIRLVNGTVTTIVNGTVLDVRNMSKAWKGEEFFFKAGDYLGNNDGTARGFGEVLYTDIHVSHQ
jgi:hypothetical protein